MPDVTTATQSAEPIRLPAELPLGQVLVALADAGDGATVTVEGAPGRAWPAKEVRVRILADVATAAGQGGQS